MQGTRSTPSPSRRILQGLLLAVVGSAFVVVGVALSDRIPWYVTAFFALCAVAGLFSMGRDRRPDRAPLDHLTIDDVGITRTAPGVREQVRWADIVRVRIITTDQGPLLEDVMFVVESKGGEGCVVPHDLAVRGGLLEA